MRFFICLYLTTLTQTTALVPTPQFRLANVDLRTCNHDEITQIAHTFIQGFHRRPSAILNPTDHVLRPLEDAKRDSIISQFQAGSSDFPAMVVTARDNVSDRIIGCSSVITCIRVKEQNGLKLLSGRKADLFEANQSKEFALREGTKRPRNVALICDLAVLPQARRQGVARALCENCFQVAQSWGYQEALLLVDEANVEARALYGKMGFVEEGITSIVDEYRATKFVGATGGGGVEEVVMEMHPVTNTLLTKNLNLGAPKRFKLGAATRCEETLRKQQIGHIIPAVIAGAAVAEAFSR